MLFSTSMGVCWRAHCSAQMQLTESIQVRSLRAVELVYLSLKMFHDLQN